MIILDRLTALLLAAVTLITGSLLSDAIEDAPEQQAEVPAVADVPFVGNPLIVQDLMADTHASEVSIPEVADLPKGITYDSQFAMKETEKLQEEIATTTTTLPLPDGPCSEYFSVALEAGWEREQLNKLGRIMRAESSCIHDIANKTYSYGLTQIEWSAHKNWLDSEFGITEREDLYDPYTNLLVARWLFDYAETNYGCGWQPWYMSGDWC